MTNYFEVQCDGLIGPTHNYSGLSFGNIASQHNVNHVAYPKKAALQGLDKMKFVHDQGIKQVILPPPLRPNKALLERHGVASMQQSTDAHAADIVRAAWSASSMWSANAATISPALDTQDNMLHITTANLASSVHRSQEASERYSVLSTIFGGVARVHEALPACTPYMDEGAANHMRLCAGHGERGVEIFIYGRDDSGRAPVRFPARQTKKACESILRLHSLGKANSVLAQQHPDAIDAGVFHNDVIAMSNEHVMIYHEQSFLDEDALIDQIKEKASFEPLFIRFSISDLPLEDAVSSYFYNSQLLTLPDGTMTIIAPLESKDNLAAKRCMQQLLDGDNPIQTVHYLDVRESMKNGGGPACLRLRVVMDEASFQQLPSDYVFSQHRYDILRQCILDHYPDTLEPGAIYDDTLALHMYDVYKHLHALFL